MSAGETHIPGKKILADIVSRLFMPPAAVVRTKLIVIDGPAGSGKSTFADQLNHALMQRSATVQIVHLDDLYEGWSGLSNPKFEAHLESWIALPVRYGLPVNHPQYDWETHRFDRWRQVPRAEFLIVEGVGALLSVLADAAHGRIWLDAATKTRANRLADRPGPAPDDWWPQWRKQEDDYFRQQEPWKSADWVVRTDE